MSRLSNRTEKVHPFGRSHSLSSLLFQGLEGGQRSIYAKAKSSKSEQTHNGTRCVVLGGGGIKKKTFQPW